MKRSAREGISIFFWPRNDEHVPVEATDSVQVIAPDERLWGLPQARFPRTEQCKIEDFFNDHRVVFDLTFCVSVLALILILSHLISHLNA